MTVKRTPRPLQNDLVEVMGDHPAELLEILQAATPRARIERIKKTVPKQAEALQARLGEDGSADNELLDDIATAEQAAYQADMLQALKHEHNRRVNLPTAETRHELWRRMAGEIRAERPEIKSKSEIARIIQKRLLESSDPDQRSAALTADAISRVI